MASFLNTSAAFKSPNEKHGLQLCNCSKLCGKSESDCANLADGKSGEDFTVNGLYFPRKASVCRRETSNTLYNKQANTGETFDRCCFTRFHCRSIVYILHWNCSPRFFFESLPTFLCHARFKFPVGVWHNVPVNLQGHVVLLSGYVFCMLISSCVTMTHFTP